jgi:hypothetical protein
VSASGESVEGTGAARSSDDYVERLLESDGRDETGRVNPIPLGMAMLGQVSAVLATVSGALTDSDPGTLALTVSDLKDFLPLLKAVCTALVSGSAEFYPRAVREPQPEDAESDRLIRAALSNLCDVVTEFNRIAESKEGTPRSAPAMNAHDLAVVVGRLGEIRFGLVTGISLADMGSNT